MAKSNKSSEQKNNKKQEPPKKSLVKKWQFWLLVSLIVILIALSVVAIFVISNSEKEKQKLKEHGDAAFEYLEKYKNFEYLLEEKIPTGDELLNSIGENETKIFKDSELSEADKATYAAQLRTKCRSRLGLDKYTNYVKLNTDIETTDYIKEETVTLDNLITELKEEEINFEACKEDAQDLSPKVQETIAARKKERETAEAEARAKEEAERKQNEINNATLSQKNALSKAKSYLSYSSFSRTGLIKQLEYEKYSNADAVWGVDHTETDWNEQAYKKAQSYLSYSAFSRGGLIDQLKYEGFTQAEAEYGVNKVGL